MFVLIIRKSSVQMKTIYLLATTTGNYPASHASAINPRTLLYIHPSQLRRPACVLSVCAQLNFFFQPSSCRLSRPSSLPLPFLRPSEELKQVSRLYVRLPSHPCLLLTRVNSPLRIQIDLGSSCWAPPCFRKLAF